MKYERGTIVVLTLSETKYCRGNKRFNTNGVIGKIKSHKGGKEYWVTLYTLPDKFKLDMPLKEEYDPGFTWCFSENDFRLVTLSVF